MISINNLREKKVFLIIDANSVIHRAFHALPPLTLKKTGEQVGAVYGFLLVFLKAIKDFHPDFIAVCFDSLSPTFRSDKFKEYKAKRKKAPQVLYDQIPKIKEILKEFNVVFFEKEGFEADDIIGTLARLAPQKQVLPKIETVILSGDSDTFQLVDDNTKVYFLQKGVKEMVLYGEKNVKAKYKGLAPKQLLDFRALRGDPSDNIPGVFGIGEKTAIDLLNQFGSLEGIYENIVLIKDNIKKKLIDHKEEAFFSKKLAEIEKYVPIDFNIKECEWREKYNRQKAEEEIKKFEFYSLINRLP